MTKFKKSILALTTISFLASCNPNADKATAGEVETVAASNGVSVAIDSTSLVTWVGSSLTGSHTGTFKIIEGVFTVLENNISGGKFTIDMNSLVALEITAEDGKADLEGHLKSPDFFDIAKFPNAVFEITAVEPFQEDKEVKSLVVGATHMIKGNFTLKGVSKSISFPAKVTISESNISASAEFSIDRSEWGLNYKGQNNPKDWVISRMATVKINVAGHK